jgi:peroxiredoxin (alkyl hydroperoxide reductase subunit C)
MSSSLGILHPTAGVALRATIIADPEGMVRFASANDLDVGRNVDEVLRVLDALQTGALTACNWQPGEPTLG